MSASLVIMAAGLGTRYGEGIKQLTPVGGRGEIIMDYSIHDAIEAGFDRIVFIIRKDIEGAFRRAIGDRIEAVCASLGVRVDLAFQELDDLPEGYSLPEGRVKPWGTGQAVLACRDILDGPFAVINADDYYGKGVFKTLYEFLHDDEHDICMAGYVLKNTLSESGGVTRGVCTVENGLLRSIRETPHIVRTPDGVEADGVTLDPESYVSMNMWGLTPEFIGLLDKGFKEFLGNPDTDKMTGEFLLPIYIGELLKKDEISVNVLHTDDRWFGMTYKEDTPGVVEAFRRFVREGVYKDDLFSDLH